MEKTKGITTLLGSLFVLALLAIFVVAFTTTTVNLPLNSTIVNGTYTINITTAQPANLSVNVTNINTGAVVGILYLSNASDDRDSNATASHVFTWATNNGTYTDGQYNLTLGLVNATNTTNNATLTIYNITVDHNPPVLWALSEPSNFSNVSSLNSTAFVINATVNDTNNASPVQTVTFYIMQGATVYQTLAGTLALPNFWNATVNATNLTEGRYNISLNATDSAGRTLNRSNIAVQVLTDRTAPTQSINNPANHSNLTGTLTLNFTVSDATMNVSSINLTFNNNTHANMSQLTLNVTGNQWTATWVTTNGSYPDNKYSLRLAAADPVGNSVVALYNVTVDSTAPVVGVTNNPANSSVNQSGNVTVNVSITDATSAVSSVLFYIVNASSGSTLGILTATQGGTSNNWSAVWNTGNGSFQDVTYNVSVNATDIVGNSVLTNNTIVGVRTNNTAPAITLSTVLLNYSGTVIRVNVSAGGPGNATFEYGTTQAALSTVLNSTGFQYNHTFNLSGLGSSARYYYNVTLCNQFNYCTESNYTFATESDNPASTSTSTGGGGGSSTTTAPTVTVSTLTKVGVSVTRTVTTVNEKITLSNLPENLGSHSVTYKSADATAKTVTLEVASTPQSVTVGVGQTKKLDLNADSIMDLAITLEAFRSASSFDLKMEVIKETTAGVALPVTTPTSTPDTTTGGTTDAGTTGGTTAPATEPAKTGGKGAGTATTPGTESSKGLSGWVWALIIIVLLIAGWAGYKMTRKPAHHHH